MRMFLSVSGHSSELSIANHSSRSTVSQLKFASGTISSWVENRQPQKTKFSTVIYAPFIQNSNQMASRLTTTKSFPRVFFNSCNFQGNVQASRLTGLLQWQKLIWFSRFVDFAVQFCFRGTFSFNEERRSSQVWQWRKFFSSNHNSLLRIATNEIASFWIDRSRQMAFSCKGGAEAGQKAGFRVMLKKFWNKKGFSLLYKTNRFHVAVSLIQ